MPNILLRAMAATTITLLVACSGAGTDASDESSSNAVTYMRTAVERPIASPIAVPDGTPIGRSLDAVLAEKVHDVTPKRTEANQDGQVCKIAEYVLPGGALWELTRCAAPKPENRSNVLAFYAPRANMPTVTFADRDADGRIDHFTDDTEGAVLVGLDDENFDGQVDRTIEAIAKIPDYVFEGYGDCALRGELANRGREDRNFDGRFEIEWATARAEDNSSFVCH